MIKNIAWNMFKNTGNIDTFLEFKQIRDIENKNIANASSISKVSTPNNGNILNTNVIADTCIASTSQKVELNGNNKNEWNSNF